MRYNNVFYYISRVRNLFIVFNKIFPELTIISILYRENLTKLLQSVLIAKCSERITSKLQIGKLMCRRNCSQLFLVLILSMFCILLYTILIVDKHVAWVKKNVQYMQVFFLNFAIGNLYDKPSSLGSIIEVFLYCVVEL